MWRRLLMWIAWPAFLAACVLELVVFAFVDPHEMQWSGHPLALSRQGAYTVAFFVFWLVSMGSSALAMVLRGPVEERDAANEANAGLDCGSSPQ